MAAIFSGSLAVAAGPKTYTAIPVSGIQSAGNSLQVSIVMPGDVFPTGLTTLTIGFSYDGGATYKEAEGGYLGPIPPGKGGVIQAQSLGFLITNSATVTHVRLRTDAPSAFTLPVSVSAVGV
jgi:hypothetical protein